MIGILFHTMITFSLGGVRLTFYKKSFIYFSMLLLLVLSTVAFADFEEDDYFFNLDSVKVVDISGSIANLIWDGFADEAIVTVVPEDGSDESREVPIEFINLVAQRLEIKNLKPETKYIVTFSIGEQSVNKEFKTKSMKITRGPYLGMVTTNSVIVSWGAPDPIDGVTISVWPKEKPELKTSYIFEPQRISLGDYDYKVTLENLEPYKRYCYQVNLPHGTTKVYEFITAPKDKKQNFVFNVYGDTQWKNTHLQVARAMAEQDDVSFLLHAGDVVDQPNPDRWQDFFSAGLEMIAQTPLYPINGNHDLHNPEFRKYFALPGDDYWYSFDYGSIHVIALDVMSALKKDSPQYQWLIKDLEESKEMPWTVVFMHYPIGYAPLSNEPRNELQRDLVPVFEKYGVNIVFSGHEHQYDHYSYNEVHYIITGGGGSAALYPCPNEWNAPYHYMRVEVSPEKLVVKGIKTNGEIVEEFIITK